MTASPFSKRDKILLCLVAALFVFMAILEFIPITYTQEKVINQLLKSTIPLLLGASGAFILTLVCRTNRLFFMPTKWLFLLPALLVAVNNFPFFTYFSGAGKLVHGEWYHWLLFACSCLLTGFYEECLFRGVLFPLLAQSFSQNKRGLVLSVLLSSAIFGASHLFNAVLGANIGETLLQVVYSTLIGGLCAMLLIKTKSIYFSILTHTVYNFCGLLLPVLGVGSWVSWQNMLIMFIPAALIGIFFLYHLVKYSEEERKALYDKIIIK